MKVPVYNRKQEISPTSRPLMSGANPEFVATKNLGDAGVNLGSILSIRQQERKKELDAIEVNNKFYGEGGLVDQTTELTQGYLELKESNAFGISQKYNKDFDELSRKWLGGFQDDEQRTKAEGLLLQYGTRKRNEIYKHEATEHQAAKKSAISTALVGALKRVQNNPDETDDAVALFKATVADLNTGVDNTETIYDAESKIRKAAETASLDKQTTAIWNAALALPQMDGEKLINKSGLSYDQKQKVLSDYRTEKKLINERIDKERDEQVEKADDKAWIDYHEGNLGWTQLKNQRTSGEISQKTFLAIEKLIKKGDIGSDNPLVVGDLNDQIALGVDVSDQLSIELEQGQISGKTYAAMRKALSNKQSTIGLKILNEALQPSPADKWSPDKNLKHSNATVDYYNKVAAGMKPVDAAQEIIQDYTSHLRRTKNGIPKPYYLNGDKNDISALNEAEEVTVRSYELNTITPSEYTRQIEIINNLKDLINDSGKTEESNKHLEELKKQVVD